MSKQRHPNHQAIVDALAANPAPLIEWAARRIAVLGAKSEWDSEDNYATTEGLAELAGNAYPLPGAGDQDDEALRFYGEAARSLYYSADIDEWPRCEGCGALRSESGAWVGVPDPLPAACGRGHIA
jgi:hypothetical protein